jgi:3-methyl-2-oxobutanoate hydroxymethyltransferase
VDAGIPVMGHVGLTPQSVHALGGYRVQGRGEAARERVLRDAIALEEAGAYAVVIEAVPASLAREITQALTVPTIGIGAGTECAGQILVGYDLLGLTPGKSAKFVRRYAEFFGDGAEAARAYARDVRSGAFPALEHTYADEAPVRQVDRPQDHPVDTAQYGPVRLVPGRR